MHRLDQTLRVGHNLHRAIYLVSVESLPSTPTYYQSELNRFYVCHDASELIATSMSALQPRPWELYSPRQRVGLLIVLFLIAASNVFDANVISVLLEPIKREFQVSDTMLGLLSGFSFSLLYALIGIPVARWADRGNRRTILAFALTVWSVMTVFCGLAQTFGQLALARLGVGAGESGATPAAQSLIADYFPPDRRASAYALLTSGSTVGYLLSVGLGGYVAARFGWRAAFLIAGLPGIALVLAARFVLREPRLRIGSPSDRAGRESIFQTLAQLKAKRSFVYALIAYALYCSMVSGALVFIPSFLIRVLHMSLTDVGVSYGALVVAASLIGTLSGGWIADRLGSRDIRWLAWLPSIACGLAAPVYVAALAVTQFRWFLLPGFVAWVLLNGILSLFAAIHAVCGSRRRATAIAILLLSGALFGGGFGPLMAGALSDALSAVYGADGLRYSLMIMMSTLVVASGFLYLCGRALPADLEN
jgi:predicted MFS family arabinose efflux permease